jgi:two-component system chemotaxis sensor kinase CheA
MLYIVKKLHNFEHIINSSIKDKTIDNQIRLITTEDMYAWLEIDLDIIKNILGDDYFNKSNDMSISKERIKQLYEKINNGKLKVQDIKDLEYYNIKIFFRPFSKLVEQLSKRLNKPLNPLVLNSQNIYLPEEYQPFLNSLVHIFRNSVDHGIESLDERVENMKPNNGTIKCNISKNNNILTIIISDNGRGIDIDKIKSLAVEKGIYNKTQIDTLDEQESLLIVFKDTFSTSQTITDISGRGVGLASILAELNRLNGSIYINNEFGKGIEFKFNIPLK